MAAKGCVQRQMALTAWGLAAGVDEADLEGAQLLAGMQSQAC